MYLPDAGDIEAEDIMSSRDKRKVFELLKDPILRPPHYEGMLISNDFKRAKWSHHPFYRGQHCESRCLLGLLTTNNDLAVYARSTRRYSEEEGWIEPWEILVDISSVYNDLLLDSWTVRKHEDILEEYKSRLYQLAIIDFIWMPEWGVDTDHVTNSSDEQRAVFGSGLMTFHANGELCLWEIQASPTESPSYSANLISIECLLPDKDESFTCAEFRNISDKMGLLIIGTSKGIIKGIFIEKVIDDDEDDDDDDDDDNDDKEDDEDDEPGFSYKFHTDAPVLFWGDADMMKIDNLLLMRDSFSPKDAAKKGWKLAAVKHPNFLLATNIVFNEESPEALFDEISFVRLAGGPIVGLTTTEEEHFIVSHDTGFISTIVWDDFERIFKEIPDSKMELLDPFETTKVNKVVLGGPVHKFDKDESKKTIVDDQKLIFQGLGLSPNKSLLCVAKSVGVYYDPQFITHPTQVVFYSLLPKDCMLSHVRKLYAENRFSLRAISDVLVAYRFYLRSEDEGETFYRQVYEFLSPTSERSTEELRLLFWCLNVKPEATQMELDVANAQVLFIPKAPRRLVAKEKLVEYRLDVLADRIMMRRCASLIKAVLQNQHIPAFSLSIEKNKQSLVAMYSFLDSKNQMHPDVTYPPCPTFDPQPAAPLCFWCETPIEFPTEVEKHESPLVQFSDVLDKDGDVLVFPIDSEQITGFAWNDRRHPIKESGSHLPELCALSLIPLQFPYRRCINCAIACLMEPAFAQLPYCPFCNSFMFPIQLPMSDTEAQPEETSIDENVAHSSSVLIKSEPQDIPSSESQNPTDQPYLPYQSFMSTVYCDPAVGFDWPDQYTSTSEDDDDEDEVTILEDEDDEDSNLDDGANEEGEGGVSNEEVEADSNKEDNSNIEEANSNEEGEDSNEEEAKDSDEEGAEDSNEEEVEDSDKEGTQNSDEEEAGDLNQEEAEDSNEEVEDSDEEGAQSSDEEGAQNSDEEEAGDLNQEEAEESNEVEAEDSNEEGDDSSDANEDDESNEEEQVEQEEKQSGQEKD